MSAPALRSDGKAQRDVGSGRWFQPAFAELAASSRRVPVQAKVADVRARPSFLFFAKVAGTPGGTGFTSIFNIN